MKKTSIAALALLVGLPSVAAQSALENAFSLLWAYITNDTLIYATTFILFFVLLYGAISAALSRAKVFEGEKGRPNKAGKIVSLSISFLAVISLFYTLRPAGVVGTIETLLKPFSTLTIIAITFVIYAAVYFSFKEGGKFKDKRDWKTALAAAGFTLIVIGQILDDPAYASWGWFIMLISLFTYLLSEGGLGDKVAGQFSKIMHRDEAPSRPAKDAPVATDQIVTPGPESTPTEPDQTPQEKRDEVSEEVKSAKEGLDKLGELNTARKNIYNQLVAAPHLNDSMEVKWHTPTRKKKIKKLIEILTPLHDKNQELKQVLSGLKPAEGADDESKKLYNRYSESVEKSSEHTSFLVDILNQLDKGYANKDPNQVTTVVNKLRDLNLESKPIKALNRVINNLKKHLHNETNSIHPLFASSLGHSIETREIQVEKEQRDEYGQKRKHLVDPILKLIDDVQATVERMHGFRVGVKASQRLVSGEQLNNLIVGKGGTAVNLENYAGQSLTFRNVNENEEPFIYSVIWLKPEIITNLQNGTVNNERDLASFMTVAEEVSHFVYNHQLHRIGNGSSRTDTELVGAIDKYFVARIMFHRVSTTDLERLAFRGGSLKVDRYDLLQAASNEERAAYRVARTLAQAYCRHFESRNFTIEQIIDMIKSFYEMNERDKFITMRAALGNDFVIQSMQGAEIEHIRRYFNSIGFDTGAV